ncbi:MAG TPA: hypothetical protein VLG76_08770 [Rhabdochlamydiaceae bacterium]|nr:hypothetical protein [Rhabdochlamydiaceae bacterium]
MALPALSSFSSLIDPANPFGDKNVILKRHKPEYAQKIVEDTANGLSVVAVAEIIADYVVEDRFIMDRAGWKEYFGVDIGEATQEVQTALSFSHFYRVYHALNPIDVMKGIPADKARQVCESCLIPVVIPERFTSSDFSCYFNLRTLGALAQHPKKGHAAKYWRKTEALKQHEKTRVKRSCVVICLQGVVARNKPWSQQVEYLKKLNTRTNYGCEEEPDALSQNTALFTHQVVTGKRPFSDGKKGGMEDQVTFGCTRELVQSGLNKYHMVSGSFEVGSIVSFRGSAPAELFVEHLIRRFDCGDYGVGVLRKLPLVLVSGH